MSQMENWNTNKLKDLGSITANGVNKKIDLSEIPVSLVNYMDVYSYNKIDNNFEFQQVTANQRQIENCNCSFVCLDDIICHTTQCVFVF